ncbi:uncharacterized protein EDB91DRAFT_1147515 [Suillus paluster]|uniref:uncharacterized protein n=1 Tax=Suillus paluster TaxID=48578 RepID=UPI001B87DA67|nr:uncharacterized protein EDB91DRAFT_1147515 [Suillus paluster]KAG1734092.1 hypothetical protein EDB91DRAFT_1147515 [Suillus paluster]
MKDGLAVIPMSEDSKTLDSFLRFFYPLSPAEDPTLDNLADALLVLIAAKKFMFDLVEKIVCQVLLSTKVLEKEPLRRERVAQTRNHHRC